MKSDNYLEKFNALKVGDAVFVVDCFTQKNAISTSGVVTKVGRRYITVACDFGSSKYTMEMIFDKTDSFGYLDNYIWEKDPGNGSPQTACFLSETDYQNLKNTNIFMYAVNSPLKHNATNFYLAARLLNDKALGNISTLQQDCEALKKATVLLENWVGSYDRDDSSNIETCVANIKNSLETLLAQLEGR